MTMRLPKALTNVSLVVGALISLTIILLAQPL
jgi:peptide/nickel transport system permease protein